MAVVRGCGTRAQGGVYLEVPTSPYGRPIEDFLVDPPQRPGAAVRSTLSSVGVHLVPDRHREVEPDVPLMHVLDVVGASHYPNVADFVEEAGQHGVSRRIARTANMTGLGPGSRLYLLHPKAYIRNHPEYYQAIAKHALVRDPLTSISEWRPGVLHRCPKRIADHATELNLDDRTFTAPETCCAGLWWFDVEGGQWNQADQSLMAVRRKIGGTVYNAHAMPYGVQSRRELAIFMSLPIARVAVIRAGDGSHERIASGVEKMVSLPVSIEEA